METFTIPKNISEITDAINNFTAGAPLVNIEQLFIDDYPLFIYITTIISDASSLMNLKQFIIDFINNMGIELLTIIFGEITSNHENVEYIDNLSYSTLYNQIYCKEISDEYHETISLSDCKNDIDNCFNEIEELREDEDLEDLEDKLEKDIHRKLDHIGWLTKVSGNKIVGIVTPTGGVMGINYREEGDGSYELYKFLETMGENPFQHIGELHTILFEENFINDYSHTELSIPGIVNMKRIARKARKAGHNGGALSYDEDQEESALPAPIIDKLTGRISYTNNDDTLIDKYNNNYLIKGWIPLKYSQLSVYKDHYIHIITKLYNDELLYNNFIKFLENQFHYSNDIKEDADELQAGVDKKKMFMDKYTVLTVEMMEEKTEPLQDQVDELHAQADALQDQVDELHAQADALQVQADPLQAEADALQAQADVFQADEKENREKADAFQTEADALQDQVDALHADALQAEADALQADEENQKDAEGLRVVAGELQARAGELQVQAGELQVLAEEYQKYAEESQENAEPFQEVLQNRCKRMQTRCKRMQTSCKLKQPRCKIK